MSYFRMAALFFIAVAVNWWWAYYLSFSGLSPQILLVLTIVAAARLGSNLAMCFGFSWGLAMDVFSAHLFGANALALTLVGYGVGAVRRQVDVNGFGSLCVVVLNMTWGYFIFKGILGLVFMRYFSWIGWTAFLLDPLYNCLLLPIGLWAWNTAIGAGGAR